MNKKYISIIGWYGAVALIVAYGLISFNFVTSQGFLFQFLNLTGALGIVIHSFNRKEYPAVVLNIFWFIIAFVAILKIVM